MDVFDSEKRSRVMAAIRSRNTKPEVLLRKELHHRGYRFRLHEKSLPGTPDIVFPKFRTVIQVRGCFWHGHGACIDGHLPKSNKEYWKPKIKGNVLRDARNDSALRRAGWRVIQVWECRIGSPNKLNAEVHRIVKLLAKDHQ